MIDHRRLKVMLTPQQRIAEGIKATATDETAADSVTAVDPVSVETQCPVCHWGLRVTVEPVEVAP
jgi:hypothetical protein